MSNTRRTVKPPEWLETILEDIKNVITPLGKSPQQMYKELEAEIPTATLDDIPWAFYSRIEHRLRNSKLQGLVDQEAARAYADLFDINSVLVSIATVTDIGIEYLRRRKEQITYQALMRFWDLSPLGDLVIRALRHLNSRTEDRENPDDGVRILSRAQYRLGISPAQGFPDETFVRIRKCWFCNTLFWAGRMDKLTCSTKCGDARRQSLVRERKRDKGQEYREQHRKNRQAYRDRKKCEAARG